MGNIQTNLIRSHRLYSFIVVGLVITLLSYLFLSLIKENTTYAAQTREAYSSKINNYPGFKELIDNLKAKHPNWNFTILYTGLDWDQVIKNETTARHGRSLVTASKPSSWFCSVCGDKPYDNGSWRCASEAAVAYYMDPRNALNDDYVFQFESLSYNGDVQNIDGVKQILKDVGYMQGDTITYTKTDGSKGTINKSYAQVIMEAAQEAKISPYHLAARIRQEQGTGSSPSALASGTYSGFVGYYNFLNIKAGGGSTAEIINNGLTYAKNNGLTDPEKSIKAGAKFLAKDYISTGQDTLYLQKYDVDDSDGSLYYFQYMQNIAAAKSEGYSVKQSYEKMGMLNGKIDFVIPVFENMPETPCGEPGTEGIVTQNIKVKGSNVYVREAKSTSSTVLATVNTGDILLRIETATTTTNGYYWDKVVLPDGRKGYMVRNYIVEISNVTNCNDTVMANTSVNLRNGPGTSGTTVITTLVKGQMLTRIEKGKYNLDGYIWDRVVLADGRNGYIAQNYIELVGNSGGGTSTGELIKVICNSGLKVREQPGTDKRVLTYLDKNDTLTRVQKNVSTVNGYNWDKIVTADGVEGYIASGNASETYVEVVSSGGNSGGNSQGKNDDFKIQDTNIICEPNTTVETIKEKYSGKTITVKKPDGTTITTGNIGTGYSVTIEKSTYTIVKKGDVTGDAEINSADLLKIQKHLLKAKVETNSTVISAMDANSDGTVNSADLLKIQKYLLKVSEINI
ncbi:MAG: SH3 domain-containing protein [Clostridia bacterium]